MGYKEKEGKRGKDRANEREKQIKRKRERERRDRCHLSEVYGVGHEQALCLPLHAVSTSALYHAKRGKPHFRVQDVGLTAMVLLSTLLFSARYHVLPLHRRFCAEVRSWAKTLDRVHIVYIYICIYIYIYTNIYIYTSIYIYIYIYIYIVSGGQSPGYNEVRVFNPESTTP